MVKTQEQVKKLVETYLKTEHIHKSPVKNITCDSISTYDGEYPSYVIEYSCEHSENDDNQRDELVDGIQKYTNLKVNKDYWLGLKWSWNS
jgi:hypothetical protein